MSLPAIDAVCQNCSRRFTEVPKRSFLGFQKVACPSCEKKSTYPLTSGYRATYWVLLALMVVGFIGTLSQGGIAGPGIFGIAIIIALIKDSSIKKKVKALEDKAENG
ncbi:MAG: hypothetical protein ABSF79_12045 [Smithellaceae bacterium]